MANTITTAERREVIIRQVRQYRHVRVEDLPDRFHVSTVTIRSDMNYLNDKGLIIRSRGGATIPEIFSRELPLRDKNFLNNEKKEALARKAATLVCDGKSLIMDSGTTTERPARYLTDKHNLVVMTNGLNVANELARHPNIEVRMTGF
ncbi:DeoR/GlpR family DNA-binding transcription regulator [Sansalvadorimonas sp. 2012CJ34-2]|uniref:DeoR/GlpR family DNA-binding transcription regulator n=1 Tax=Parendozoicomonas callyspongiae TaxID=2942213 RepID=A0ABT0PEG4_9GAMM|nr:DeoR/GlpR family DNA-binding transcription regulator [Sansalvadorimonas sp. 2012CJ34-2]MCL6268933.1 DeoR/GlpR family DNA-binding transcription regulator [Sansalvadorimonas sp. 2012CJ34-2]